jgi:hypothetical protein
LAVTTNTMRWAVEVVDIYRCSYVKWRSEIAS